MAYSNVFTSSFDAETVGVAPAGFTTATWVVATPGLNSSTNKVTGTGTLTRSFAAWNKVKLTFRFKSGASTAVRNLRVFANRSGTVPTTSDTCFVLVFEAGGTVVANFDTVGYVVSSAVLQTWAANTEYLVTVTIDCIEKTVVYSINGVDYTRIVQSEAQGYNFYRANISNNMGYIMFDSASSSAGLDDISVDNYVPSDAVELLDPTSYRTYQRDANNQGDITISGRYSGTPAAIEARWNAGSWVTIQSNPTEGKFSGTLSNQPVGQHTFECRVVNDLAFTASSTYVGIGDVYLVAGQSNNSGRGTNNQVYSHASLKACLYKNNNTWAELSDPFDLSTGENDVNTDPAAGSWIPLFATQYLAGIGVPVAFVPVAIGGKTSAQLQPPANHTDRTSFYGSKIYRALKIGAGGINIKAILWWQGESDGQASVAQATYVANMNIIIAAFLADLGVKLIICKLQTCGGIGDAAELEIRNGIQQLWDTNANVIQGPDLVSIVADDGLHAQTDAHLLTAATLWFDAVNTWLSSLDQTPPTITAQQITQVNSLIILTVSESLTASGEITDFSAAVNGVNVSIVSVELIDPISIYIYVSGAIFEDDIVSVSYSGTSIQDSSGNLMEPFGPISVTNNSTETGGSDGTGGGAATTFS